MRYRSNLQTGTLTASATSGATSLQSAEFANLPPVNTVASNNYLALTLDPGGTDEEIVWVTSHTASSTTVTVRRGQEGSTGAAQDNGATWVHAPTTFDFLPWTPEWLPIEGSQAYEFFETETTLASSDFSDGTAPGSGVGGASNIKGHEMYFGWAGFTATECGVTVKSISSLTLPSAYLMIGQVAQENLNVATGYEDIVGICLTDGTANNSNIVGVGWRNNTGVLELVSIEGNVGSLTLNTLSTVQHGWQRMDRLFVRNSSGTWSGGAYYGDSNNVRLSVTGVLTSITPTHMGVFASDLGGSSGGSYGSVRGMYLTAGDS